MKTFTLILVLSVLAFSGFAQDKIVKRNKEIINCIVKEIGTEEIKYIFPDREDLMLSIEISKVSKVIFKDGREMSFKDEMYNPENYADQKKHAIKFAMFSPLTNHLRFAYEQNYKPGISFLGSISYIGAGSSMASYEDAMGVGFSVGAKFSKEPEFNEPKIRFNNLMAGRYIKPTIYFASFNYNELGYSTGYPYQEFTIPSSKTSLAIMLEAGSQWVYAKTVVINWYVGLGYGFAENGNGGSYYDFTVAPKEFPVAFSAGFEIGILF